MIVLPHRLRVALIFACVSRCSSQSECEKVDGEIVYPDRCGGDDKDLCRRGYYLRISSPLCGENGSADDWCMRCEEETYMPNFNYCTSCRTTTKCKDYERESREPTITVDRECIPNPATSAPPITANCPVCECPTQSNCPPCPPPEKLTTDLYTSGQGTSDSPTTFVTPAANATREPRYPEGNDDYWKRLAIGLCLGICLCLVVIVLLVCIICRKRGVCPQCKRKYKNGEKFGRNKQDEDCEIVNLEIIQPVKGGVCEADAANEHNEMGDRNPPIEPEIPELEKVHPADVAQNDSLKAEAPGPHSNPFPADGHLNPGKSSENTTPMSLELATKGPNILIREESVNSGNTFSLQPLLSSQPETNHSPSLQDANRDTKARNGSEGLRNKGNSQPSESMEPLLSNNTSSIFSSRYDSSCKWEADESTEKPCGRTCYCRESHINLVKDEMSIVERTIIFDRLHISKNKVDEKFYDNQGNGVREQIRAVLLWWLHAHEEQPIVKLFCALENIESAKVIRLFKVKFNAKQIE